QFSLFSIAQYHKLQICLRGLYNLYTHDIPCDLANGWIQYHSNCYKLKADTRRNWVGARSDCVQEGGDLVSIASAGEEHPTGISLWMGGHDSVTEGGWEWSNGSPFRYIQQTTEYLFFTGNPDNFNGEDCLSILINNGYWNDDTCQQKRGYICKRKGEICCFNCC
uniref:C-type lectin domain-containing protein n=1 Tax=Cyclopterus lumpus TaxID=8103 RepID=A0A8C2WGV9_CYCLU